MAGSAVSTGFAAVALSLASGCGLQTDGLRRDLTKLEREVATVSAANVALRERVDALEAGPGSDAAKPAEATAAPGDADRTDSARPQLKVVRLTPDDQPSDGWTFIDPSDPKHDKLPVALAPAGEKPATIRTLGNGAVVAERPAASPIARKVTP